VTSLERVPLDELSDLGASQFRGLNVSENRINDRLYFETRNVGLSDPPHVVVFEQELEQIANSYPIRREEFTRSQLSLSTMKIRKCLFAILGVAGFAPSHSACHEVAPPPTIT
jgi:hypothetical protein